MPLHSQDTIVALSTCPGPGARAVIRLSGPASADIVASVFRSEPPVNRGQRSLTPGTLRLETMHSPLPADVYFWPAPHSYTGQDVAEIHILSSQPLVELLVAQLLRGGARAAQPGEFTLRAFLAGKIDLTRAEAVQAVVSAGNPDELRQALTQLAGGMATPLHQLRDDLLSLLADVEAGLDFADEDIRFVGVEETLLRLTNAMARLELLRKQLQCRALSVRPFRVVLAGRPNAGKSSLFNALAGATALVSAEPGTTRDYLTSVLQLGELSIELVDTPGTHTPTDTIEGQAQELGREQLEAADVILLCLEAGSRPTTEENKFLSRRQPSVIGVSTKVDLRPGLPSLTATSAVTGAGLVELKQLLAQHARAQQRSALAPSLSRSRNHIESCLGSLRRAHRIVLFEDPPELLALELREALEQLGQIVGAVYTDDLLDRIFSRFCIGK